MLQLMCLIKMCKNSTQVRNVSFLALQKNYTFKIKHPINSYSTHGILIKTFLVVDYKYTIICDRWFLKTFFFFVSVTN